MTDYLLFSGGWAVAVCVGIGVAAAVIHVARRGGGRGDRDE